MEKKDSYQITNQALSLVPDYCVGFFNEHRILIEVHYFNLPDDAEYYYRHSVDFFDLDDGNKDRKVKVRSIRFLALNNSDGVLEYVTRDYHVVKRYIY